MLLLTIVILIVFMIYLLRNKISLDKLFLSNNTKEEFLITVKDRQKIGTTDNDDGAQPKSSYKAGGVNYESCYSTETRNGNTTGRYGRYYCDNGVDAGEVIPADGLYSIDFTNYKIHPGKAIRGKALTGIHSFNGKTYTLNSNGMVVNPNEKLTLAESKSFCDSLRDKCIGFIMIIPTKGSELGSHTIFISKLDEGWEDPDTYVKITNLDSINTNIVSYVKKNVNAVEKAIPQDKLNTVSNKYKNLATCNWKSSNRCIFKDYTYDQSSNNCVAKDENPSYSVDALTSYNEGQLSGWLDTLYKRDSGVNKLTSEAINVNEYVQRCKELDGYEFLAGIPLPNPYIPTTKPGDVKGRFVRITINNPSDNWLHFAELQVISNNRNIAFRKPASASSTYNGTPPSRGNDGNSLGELNNNSVAHNDNNTGGPEYWEVDLGDASQTIDRVIISNRTDGNGARLNNWLLSIYDYNRNLIWARIYREAPNPTVSIDIFNANNDMNNIRVKDYNQSRFNNYFHRISDTEYNSKRGWDGKGCYDTCHKEICEGESKKWIGNSNWYGCRDYKPGEYEAEQEEKRRLEEERRNSIITVYEHCNYQGRSLNMGIGTHDYNFINGNGFNDIISSIKVPSGLRAVAWEHNPGEGRGYTFESDNACIVNLGMNDTISSIIVSRIPKFEKTLGGGSNSAKNTEFICNNGPNDTLTSADIRSGGWMDGIKLNCSSGKNQTFGGQGGGPSGSVNLGNSMRISTSPNDMISNINGVGSSWVARTDNVSCQSGKRLKGMEVGTDNGDNYIQRLSLLCG